MKKTHTFILTALIFLGVGALVVLVAGVMLIRVSPAWVSYFFDKYSERGQSPTLWTQVSPNPGAAASTEYIVRDDRVFVRVGRLLLSANSSGQVLRRLPEAPTGKDEMLTRLFAMAYEVPESYDGEVLVARFGVFVPVLSGGMVLNPQDYANKGPPLPEEEVWSLVWIKLHPLGFSLATILAGGCVWSFSRIVRWGVIALNRARLRIKDTIHQRRLNAGLCPWCSYPLPASTIDRVAQPAFDGETVVDPLCTECGRRAVGSKNQRAPNGASPHGKSSTT